MTSALLAIFISPVLLSAEAANLGMSLGDTLGSSAMSATAAAVTPYYYGWRFIFGLTLIVAFLDAYGIGANDVANSFATSVGSRTLTLRQAICIAIFSEFLGSVLLGKTTADTVRNKIINVGMFDDNPGLLMLAMFSALVGSSSFVLFATYMGLPVSTTHSIVGAIMGTGIAAFGVDGVLWDYSSGGFNQIVASWFISPATAGVLGAVLWLSLEHAVLRHEDAYRRALISVPFYTFGTVTYIVFFMTYKGIPRVDAEKDLGGVGPVVGMSIGIGAAVTLLVVLFLLPWLKRRVETQFAREEAARAAAASDSNSTAMVEHPQHKFSVVMRGEKASLFDDTSSSSSDDMMEDSSSTDEVSAPKVASLKALSSSSSSSSSSSLAVVPPSPSSSSSSYASLESFNKSDDEWANMSAFERAKHIALRGVSVDVVSHPELSEMHAAARKFDPRAEILYSFLQVLTATFASFAHGSNDIANACGPLATVYAIYDSPNFQYDVTGKNDVPVWVLVFCAVALDIGLATYGYNIMRELGNKITYHSPARGFTMELAAGVAVLFASKQGWPISTTHCITGATICVGLVSGNASAVNWKRALAYFMAWVVTVPCAGLIAGLFFSMLAYSPKAYTPSTTL